MFYRSRAVVPFPLEGGLQGSQVAAVSHLEAPPKFSKMPAQKSKVKRACVPFMERRPPKCRASTIMPRLLNIAVFFLEVSM